MEYKYTTDGKKVVVIGDLNNQEKIVQEIFVSNGKEFPSGENFVVKNLHDELAESWKEKRLRELEENYDKESKRLTESISSTKKELNKVISVSNEKINYYKKFFKNSSDESFDTFQMIMKDEIKYVVEGGNSLEIKEINDFKANYDDRYLKLITLFGKDDGSMKWGINTYSDGSGYNRDVEFFRDYESAVGSVQEKLNKRKRISMYDIPHIKESKLKIPKDLLKKLKKTEVESLEDRISDRMKDVEKLRKSIDDIKSL